jgi:hypothetical protein
LWPLPLPLMGGVDGTTSLLCGRRVVVVAPGTLVVEMTGTVVVTEGATVVVAEGGTVVVAQAARVVPVLGVVLVVVVPVVVVAAGTELVVVEVEVGTDVDVVLVEVVLVEVVLVDVVLVEVVLVEVVLVEVVLDEVVLDEVVLDEVVLDEVVLDEVELVEVELDEDDVVLEPVVLVVEPVVLVVEPVVVEVVDVPDDDTGAGTRPRSSTTKLALQLSVASPTHMAHGSLASHFKVDPGSKPTLPVGTSGVVAGLPVGSTQKSKVNVTLPLVDARTGRPPTTLFAERVRPSQLACARGLLSHSSV